MNEFIDMVKIGLGLGVGFYIGFEGLKTVTSVISAGLRWLIEWINGDDEEE